MMLVGLDFHQAIDALLKNGCPGLRIKGLVRPRLVRPNEVLYIPGEFDCAEHFLFILAEVQVDRYGVGGSCCIDLHGCHSLMSRPCRSLGAAPSPLGVVACPYVPAACCDSWGLHKAVRRNDSGARIAICSRCVGCVCAGTVRGLPWLARSVPRPTSLMREPCPSLHD